MIYSVLMTFICFFSLTWRSPVILLCGINYNNQVYLVLSYWKADFIVWQRSFGISTSLSITYIWVHIIRQPIKVTPSCLSKHIEVRLSDSCTHINNISLIQYYVLPDLAPSKFVMSFNLIKSSSQFQISHIEVLFSRASLLVLIVVLVKGSKSYSITMRIM